MNWLLEQDFLKAFSASFKEFSDEIKWMELVDLQGLFRGFYENRSAALWQKRIFVQKALYRLVQSIKEYEAVEIVESLLAVFGWNDKMEIRRQWDVAEEDKARFHDDAEEETPEKSESIEEEKGLENLGDAKKAGAR